MRGLMKRLAGRREEGTALMTAILMTALMAVIAVELVDRTRFALFRTANADQRDEAYWYALGAREFAEGVILRSGPPGREVMRPGEAWAGDAQVFPIEGGTLVGEIRDGNNCLNLNALAGDGVEGEEERPALSAEDNRAMFSVLLERLGVPPDVIEPVKAQIVDWIDANTYREPRGAEDEVYRAFDPPLRAANQRLYEVEELLVLPAMTPQLFALIRPYVCVRDTSVQPPFNLNTLQLDQAVLLSALFQGRLSVGDAEAVLLERPPTGYESLDDFFARPVIAALEPDLALREAVTLRTRWFEIDVTVRLGETEFTLSELAELGPGGSMERRYQRFGAVR
ncbi:general secretion pathway protein GspK [Marinicauda algicola]|uniref:Type II secretion system protein K n=2 Tax=Marinicauda algicola TaxID=2029849 RepID=A0A4S2H455_9PROT|nr:general secretion pathway protein GspK [Marinicauda algicola]